MRYALYLHNEDPDVDYFCILDSIEALDAQVHDPTFAARFIRVDEIQQLEHGFPLTIQGESGMVCIRPFDELKR